MSSGKKRMEVALDADLVDQVDALAAERGQDRDHAIASILRRSLKQWAKRRPKEREIHQPPEWIILRAKAVQEAARKLGADGHDPAQLQPVLLALAVEIALKAWQVREREGAPPDHGHDLVELFDALHADTQARLRERFQVRSDTFGAQSADPFGMVGMKEVLEAHRETFEHWRYVHEHDALFASSQLDEALTAIIEAYGASPREHVALGNMVRSRRRLS